MPDAVESPFQVHVQDPVKALLLHHGQQAVLGHPGVVHQDVHGAKLLFNLGHQVLHRGKIRHVAAVGHGFSRKLRRALGAQFLRQGLAAGIDHRHVGPLRGQLSHNGRADAPGTTGDHRRLSCQHPLTSFKMVSKSAWVDSA